jgi:hypothetical protein
MRPTITFLHQRFNYFNDLCFEGKLPQVRIRLTTARTFGGRLHYKVSRGLFDSCRYIEPIISISTLQDYSETEYEDILLHEMIHLYILVNRIKDTSAHGEEFQGLMRMINIAFQRHITVSLRNTNADTRIRIHLVCVSQLTDDRTGVTVSARTCFYELWDDIARHPKVLSTKWYLTDDPYFNRFPRSRTLKIYRADPQELTEHLASAYTVHRQGDHIVTRKPGEEEP